MGDLGTDAVESVCAWLDGVHREVQRVAQHLAEVVRIAGAHDSRSRTERRAAIAREVWLLTAPRVIPIIDAI